jgi:formate-dependent nitrite reductase membrane component NrfD
LIFLAATNFLLILKLERRERFLWVLTRPQWRSWLARGAYIMIAYGALLTALLALERLALQILPALIGLTTLGAAGTAVYSAFLFNQAKGRDLWQSPLLPLHLLVQAVVAGAGALVLASLLDRSLAELQPALGRILAGGLALNLLTLGAEFFSHHATADAEAAAAILVKGRLRHRFWWGVFALGNVIPIVLLARDLTAPAAALSLGGLFLFEDLFVEAGQSIPLA